VRTLAVPCEFVSMCDDPSPVILFQLVLVNFSGVRCWLCYLEFLVTCRCGILYMGVNLEMCEILLLYFLDYLLVL